MATKQEHSAIADYKKTKLQDKILQGLFEIDNIVTGDIKFTKKGGAEDKAGIDAFITTNQIRTSNQIKMDYKCMITESVAIEFASLKLNTSDKPHRMYPPIAEGITNPDYMNVDFLWYIMPGYGISIYNPKVLSRLVFHMMASIPMGFDGIVNDETLQPLRGENKFRIGVAPNKDGETNLWNTLNYIIPAEFLMFDEIPLGQYSNEFNEVTRQYESVFYPNGDTPVRPAKIYDWSDIKFDLMRSSQWGSIQEQIADYIYFKRFGSAKASIICDYFDLRVSDVKLYNHNN